MRVFWAIFSLVWLGVLLLVDLACKLTGRDTLSATIRVAAKRWPLLAFALGTAVGFLMLHFFPTT